MMRVGNYLTETSSSPQLIKYLNFYFDDCNSLYTIWPAPCGQSTRQEHGLMKSLFLLSSCRRLQPNFAPTASTAVPLKVKTLISRTWKASYSNVYKPSSILLRITRLYSELYAY